MVVRSRGYLALLERATAVLQRHDPVGLVAAGAPADEYELEADAILPRLRSASSARDVARLAHEEFARWFDADTAGPASRYDEIGDELWAVWLDSRDGTADST